MMRAYYLPMYFTKRRNCIYIVILLVTVITLVTENEALARRYFMLERPQLDYKLSYEFEQEERIGVNIDRKDSSMTYFEGLDINTGGYVYHPALLAYSLELSPQWEQFSQKIEKPVENKLESRTFLEGYTAEIDFLQYKPYSLNIMGSRKKLTLSRNFAERIKEEINMYGARLLLLQYGSFPTNLDYLHTENKQTGAVNSDKEKDAWQLIIRHNKNLGSSQFKAVFNDVNTTTRGKLVGSAEEKVDFENIYDFAKDKSLRSYLQYRNIEGDTTDSERYSIRENYSWRPSKSLRANTNLHFETNDFPTARSEGKGVGLNITHSLYESLTTSFNTFATKNQFSDTKEVEYGSGLNFDYKKKIPGGILNITLGNNYVLTNQEINDNFIDVRDESATLTIGTTTFLANKKIVIDSVDVWDNARTIKFQEGFDYILEERDSLLRIRCVPGGLIDTNFDCTTGAPVIVDYRYITEPAYDFSTYTQAYGVTLNFKNGWSLFYNYYNLEERFLRGIEPDQLSSDEIHTAGTDLTWKWSTTGIQYTDSATTNAPSRSWRASESINIRPFEKLYINVAAHYGQNRFVDRGDEEEFSSAVADLQMLTSRKSKLSLKGFWDRISGDREKTTISGLSAMFEWAYRLVQGSIQYEYREEDDEIFQEKTKNHYFYMEVKTAQF